jgi:hypothetical protein
LNVTAATTDTVARTFAAAISTATTNSSTRTLPNLGLGLSATDQWTQQWGIAPLTDPDQLRRLRVLRWSRFTGQFGGQAKMDSGLDYAASFSSFSCIA